MKLFVYTLLFGVILFFINILLYNTVDEYQFYLKKIKYQTGTIYIDETVVSDEYKIKAKPDINIDNILLFDENKDTNKTEDIINNKAEEKINDIDDSYSAEIIDEIQLNADTSLNKELNSIENGDFDLTDVEKKFLALFKKNNLKRKDTPGALFGFTREFPNKYKEYEGKDLTIYMFNNAGYKLVKNFFQKNQTVPLNIKEVNNFGDNSFFINLKQSDGLVRIVLKHNFYTFGLKFNKNKYNEIKKIFKTINN